MKTHPVPQIDDYRFGRVVIDGNEYRQDLILFPSGVQERWDRGESHLLSMSDLATVLENPPQVLIIGTGYWGSMKVPDEVLRELESRAVEPMILKSKQACEAYNQQTEQVHVVLAIHLTC